MSYKDLIIWQYKTKPKATATIDLIENEIGVGFVDLYKLQDVLNIEYANGHQLDLVGKHVGQSRIISEFSLNKFFGFNGSKNAVSFGRLNNSIGGKWYRNRDPLSKTIMLDDNNYRFMIKARIIKNYQTATMENIIESCFFLLGRHCEIIDNLNMSLTIKIPKRLLSGFQEFAIKKLDILPRQAGVKINTEPDEKQENKFFAFDGVEDAKGFNKGVWHHN